jgi:hypothetical protein
MNLPSDVCIDDTQAVHGECDRTAQIGVVSLLLVATIKCSESQGEILALFQKKVADCVASIRKDGYPFSHVLADAFHAHAEALLASFAPTGPTAPELLTQPD